MDDIRTVPRDESAFRFKLAGSKRVWRLPLLSCLPLSDVRRLRGVDEGDDAAALDAVGIIVDRYCDGLSDLISVSELGELMRMWYEASGITLGESSGSAG